MKNYQVMFLDIDGTILRPDGKIEDSTKYAINTLQQQGVEVFLATGRPLHEIAFIADALRIQSFIGYNGAFASYRNEVIVNEPMQEKTVSHFVKTAEKMNHDLLLYSSKENIFSSLDSPVIKEMIEFLNFQHNKVFTSGDEKGVLSASLLNITEEDLVFYQTDEDIHFTPVLANDQKGKNFYDAIRDNVTKGSAIKKLLHRLSIPVECSIAFGDGLNDKEMLETVGEGFAMGNAHPLLFDYAKHATSPVTDNGVYNGLRKLGILKD